MAKYIDEQAAIADLNETYDKMAGFHAQFYTGYQFAVNRLRVFPAAEVEPVRHGCKFCSKEDKGAMCWDCSDLGISIEYRAGKIRITTEAGDEAYLTVEYCPLCGARMNRGADNG